MSTRVAGGVLAGGLSSRMGRDKALLEISPGRTFVEHVVSELAAVADPVLISANDPDRFAFLGRRVVADAVPGQGPLGGLRALLEAAGTSLVVVVACDMPRMTRAVLGLLIEIARREQRDVVVPRTGGNLHGLAAVWSRECLGPLAQQLALGRRDVRGLIARLQARFVDEDELSVVDRELRAFENVNTAEDVARTLGRPEAR